MVGATPALQIEYRTMSIAFPHSSIELAKLVEFKVVFPLKRFYLRVCGNKIVGSCQITILDTRDLATDAQQIRLCGIHRFRYRPIPTVLNR